MPRFEITSPDGKRYEITAPDGASQDEVLAYAQQQFSQPADDIPTLETVRAERPDFSTVQPGQSTTVPDAQGELSQYSPARRMGMAAVSGIADTINTLGNWTGLVSDEQAAQNMARIDAVRDENPVSAIGGDIATLAVPASRIGQLGRAGRYAGNAALGGAVGATRGVREGESRLGNTVTGAALGAAGEGVGDVLRAGATRSAGAIRKGVRQAAEAAKRLGVPVYAAQLSDSLPVKLAASASKYLPFSGASAANQTQQSAFNRALSRSMGANADELTDDVMRATRQQLGDSYKEIYGRNAVPLTKDAMFTLAAVRNQVARGLTEDQSRVVDNFLDDIIDNADEGVLTGEKYQALRTALQKSERNDALGSAVGQVRKALDAIAERAVGPEDAAALKDTRRKWANMRTVEKALQQVGGATGDVRPAAIWPLLRQGGTQEMRDLGRVGQLIKDPVPDSGTGARNLFYATLGTGAGTVPVTGGASLLPAVGMVAGGATLGRLANSNALANYMLRDGRGQVQNALARYSAPAFIAATPAVAETRKPTKKRKAPAR